ncbi:MAG: DUF2914 domain-containing protein [bacterium]|nr:MAG: DUF2914 domain-containing protein [bacterium]
MTSPGFFTSPRNTIHQFYQTYSKYLPVAFFVGGFLWDSLTLTRIDRMVDNLILLGYLLLLGFSIILVNRAENNLIRHQLILKYRYWYPLAIQFFLGGLFSSYVVFYFQSAAVGKNWLFLGILIILLFANEFLEKRLTNVTLQLTLYFLATFSFFNFFVPVVIKKMSVYTFIFSGILSLGVVAFFLHQFFRKLPIIGKRDLLRISTIILSLYFFIHLAYFKNWIPPVPLSLKFGGIYHQVSRSGESYQLRFEKPSWYKFLKKSDDPFRYSEGDTVYCFAAVFAPVELKEGIYHIWQKSNPKSSDWLTTDRLAYEVVGGRKGGFRGFTFKRHVVPGDWRVEVQTDDGQILGRINFKIENSDSTEKKFKTIEYQ